MADIFYDVASGSDSDDGSTRALAKATLQAALTAAGAGGRVFAKSDSVENLASGIILTSPGTAASPTTIISCDWSSDTPGSNAYAAGAQYNGGSGSGTNSGTVSFAGFAASYGVHYSSGGGSASGRLITFPSTSPWWWRFENCTITLNTTSAGSHLQIGQAASTIDDILLEFVDVTFVPGAVGQQIQVTAAQFEWRGGTLSTTAPTTLLVPGVLSSRTLIRGVDLSVMGSGKTLVNVAGVGQNRVTIENCKLGSSVAISTGSVSGPGGTYLNVVNCDSADTNYRFHQESYQGTITHDTANFRTGGASDGTTSISRKMVSTANSKFCSPLVSDPIYLWVETPGSYTATVEVISEGVTFTDAELWAEVEYPGTSGFPLSLFAHDRATNILSTPANQTSSSVGWTETLTGEVKQKLEVAFTTAEKGPIAVRVYLAKASATMYFCPKVDVA